MPAQGSRRFHHVGGEGGPPGGKDPDWEGDDARDDEAELVADPTPKTERDMVDARAPQHPKVGLGSIPSTASGFRAWKTT